jgi:hypothetical protein
MQHYNSIKWYSVDHIFLIQIFIANGSIFFMGNSFNFSDLFASLFGPKQKRILILGLDNSGKTTLLYKLQLGETVSTLPTIGFNVERICYRNIEFTCWDIGGQKKIRALWHHYCTV